jgi:hypothetical protein
MPKDEISESANISEGASGLERYSSVARFHRLLHEKQRAHEARLAAVVGPDQNCDWPYLNPTRVFETSEILPSELEARTRTLLNTLRFSSQRL